jgi:hypothetical protein
MVAPSNVATAILNQAARPSSVWQAIVDFDVLAPIFIGSPIPIADKSKPPVRRTQRSHRARMRVVLTPNR